MNGKNVQINERLTYIDVAKGLGIITVMFAHGCGFPGNTGYFFTASFMQMFFFLSGYTYKNERTVKENIRHRFKAIGIPYFVYNIILLILSFAAYQVLHKEVSKDFWMIAIGGILYSSNHLYYPDSITPNISFFNIQNAALWYLTCFLVASTIFYLIIDKLTSKKKYLLSIVILIMITIGLSKISIRLPWSMDTAFGGTVFMLLGHLARKADLLQKLGKWYYVGGIIVSYFILCMFNPGIGMSLRKYGPYGAGSVLLFIIIGYLGSLIYIYVSKIICKCPRLCEIFSYIGKKTLILLGFHGFVFLVWNTFAERLFFLQKIYWVNGIIQIIVTIIVCLALDKAVNELYHYLKSRKSFL